MEPVLTIQVTLTPDDRIGMQMGGPGTQNKALIVGVLEIVKNMVLNPPPESSPILLARSRLPAGSGGNGP